jgi:hypothetical protein
MSYFERIPLEAAQEMEEWSRLAFELRETTKQVLAPYGVETPEELLALIEGGALPDDSAREDYLAACFLATAKEDARNALIEVTRALGG